MSNSFFIAVEGPIGVGKTSLATIISQHYNIPLLKEIVEENPFLGKFYENIHEWSFQTEMFFLCNRYKQLEEIKNKYINNNLPLVSDYHIFKNKIFSQRTLDADQYLKYMSVYDILIKDMPQPNLIIYLNASLEVLLERISIRGRVIEHKIEPSYLKQLSEDYVSFMREFKKTHPDIPVIELSGDNIDFVNNKKDLNNILLAIDEIINKPLS